MSLWEKNTYLLGLGSAVGGAVYFSLVAWQSIQLGFLAPPSVATWLSYIAIQVMFSFAATSLLTRKERQESSALVQLRGGEDERDQFIRKQSEAFFGHVASAAVFAAMALWFVHKSESVFFHSLVAAMVFAELLRAGFQLSQYNRAV